MEVKKTKQVTPTATSVRPQPAISEKTSKKINKKVAVKKSGKALQKGTAIKTSATAPVPGTVSIRMYCIGTGDCFILKFFGEDGSPFTMMIDCGSCRGDKAWFEEYIIDLGNYVNKTIDLLVVTHEHLDHVNGFDKWSEIFKGFTIKEAWFAWTENPADPEGAAAELLKNRKDMKAALGSALAEVKKRGQGLAAKLAKHPFKNELIAVQEAFVSGLDSLAAINIDEADDSGKELPGMKKIKEILKAKKVVIKYLNPGDTVIVSGLADIKFRILGPPRDRGFIFKDGKEGSDVYKKNMALNESALAAKAFNNLKTRNTNPQDWPFSQEYITGQYPDKSQKAIIDTYKSTEDWRKIDDEWLLSTGSLALRLNSHINNTSLALAVESVKSGKVLLLPGDAEYGSWESWHLIENWKGKGKDGKHLSEDLLNRTVFYKVGHHLSYNGTALEKGINMMTSEDIVAMATLDRNRISEGWKKTMPNKFLLQELIRKTGGRFFIMDETEVDNAPSLVLDPETQDKKVYKMAMRKDGAAALYKQYTLQF